ncbi:hypothetical protein VMCG_04795 [Cytospora schulzeri]|uniref:Cytochrome P450 n=1 Tax=Cytospora schulzeri TaxID=448051 RepID=A0A423WMN7_9PEZI|nr:hypothetical protein VMCG_04795 [Valsa malicola]
MASISSSNLVADLGSTRGQWVGLSFASRWLPHDHMYWDSSFENDAREAFWPFSRGPRSCPGKGSAWRQTRVFIAKVLWTFDVERVPGEEVVFDRDFRSYAMWDKPKIRAYFRPVERGDHWSKYQSSFEVRFVD